MVFFGWFVDVSGENKKKKVFKRFGLVGCYIGFYDDVDVSFGFGDF